MAKKQQRIAVLGAGPMGLAVAYQLALEGYKPVVFEADDRVGGMAASFDFGGLEIERYYHFHCTSDSAFLELLDELNLSDKMKWVSTKMGFWHQNKLQPWGNPIALLRFKGLSFLAKFRYGLHAFLSTKRTNWHDLDDKSAISWIKKRVGTEAYEVLWKNLFELKFYNYSSEISAAWIWSRIRRLGTSRYSLFHEKLGYLEGGSSTLLQAISKEIERHGGEIRLSSPVREVIIENGVVKGVELDSGIAFFDKVISTIPIPYIPRLIPTLPNWVLSKFNALENIAVVCVIAKLHKPVSGNFWVNTNDTEMDIPGIIEYSNLRPLKQHLVYVPFYMPAEHQKFADPDEVFINKVRRYLKKVNPKLLDEDFIEIRASRYRHAQPICKSGHLSKLPPSDLPIEGLWVADTSYYYPEDRGISESMGFGRQLAMDVIA